MAPLVDAAGRQERKTAAVPSTLLQGASRDHGNEYYKVIDNPLTPVDEAHGFEPHYELHIWLYRQNPAGMFMPFNARVKCLGEHH